MDCSLDRLLQLVQDEDVDFDADIAGPGVLAAFLVTSLIALATLVVAYAKLSVPSRLLNTGDAIMATGVRHAYNRVMRRRKRPIIVERRERVDAFMAFMVAISDQILVSQVAILIAAFIIHAEITIYSVNILLYRQQPSDDDKNGRSGEATAITRSAGDSSTAYGSQTVVGDAIPLQTLRSVEDAQTSQGSSRGAIEVDREGMQKILQLVGGDENRQSDNSRDSYRQLRSQLFQRNPPPMSYKDFFRETREHKRDVLLNRWLKLKALAILTSEVTSKSTLRLQVGLIAENWAFHQCRGSYAWRLLWLWSGNVYGIVTIFISRTATTGMSGNPDKMGFGQVVPLALLALPVFAAMESHADYKEKVKPINSTPVQHSASMPTGDTTMRESSLNGQQTLPPDDSEALHIVKEALKSRAQDVGYPHLYNWVIGDGTNGLRRAVGCHAVLMFLITTLLGWSMAYNEPTTNAVLIAILLAFYARRAMGLVYIVADMRSCPNIIDHLAVKSLSSATPQQVGDHCERVEISQAAALEEEQDIQQDEEGQQR
ncbi:hypothetical protein F53441_13285 [Fusarium austroafricanum]|uniref:Uncharacterized protein n=1 Tax=Fusarium austroafricanum TaxID=2364996 RepID=A0A8H4NFZ1_9HYPO|nr:hypothetical protein F53441_13285 [Fusarium austroafricanum]